MSKEATSAQLNEARPEAAPLSRRERVREATLAEIKAAARRRLVAQGSGGVSLRAIAREMGMTAPGLYRYFASLDDLLLSLEADLFAELGAYVTAANEGVPEDDVDGRVLVSLRAFRFWALANRAEFTLMFGPADPRHPGSPHEDAAMEAGRRFAATFFALFDRLLGEGRFPLPDADGIPRALSCQLRAFAEATGYTSENAADGALRVLTACWVRLYGLVCMEVFQHMAFAMDDMEPLFEAELRDVLESVGVRYRPPAEGNRT
ncbi:TetR/AcrR family transcriptional regulator [Actinorugispora endophytica]|uniref:TetR family transcriptional regulator n=1 Tax=Actinorugispora endophytica TaxID=1605990 RepID=A0A4V3D7Y6_9ACTN|nr:TetR/AcrR family transcriptional regulator [Actinorugispora endophytica]TDQ49607.1 TetR family transcriptional regulator [Actinorugispora endophytica]